SMASDERFRIGPPLTEWGRISAGIGGSPSLSSIATSRVAKRGNTHLFRRAAAILVLVGGGAIVGRLSAGVRVGGGSTLALGGSDAIAPYANDAGSDGTEIGGTAQLVSSGGEVFSSPQAALASLERAQRTYEAAATYLASHDTSASSSDPSEQYRTRLAALDRTAETMGQALREAPQDPLINQYYLATMNAREQTLRRLGTVMPVGNRLGRF
ncbi:MAG: hypothetical protein ABIT38_10140, partial [Gemmatimonadaceae bacterium]